MKLDIRVENKQQIEIGDLVFSGKSKYLVIKDIRNSDYPYRLLDVENCNVLCGFYSLEILKNSGYNLLAKSTDLKLQVGE